ncbi:conserved virulence factor C family protein [Mangrovibacillus cuniculi]|uniref:Virulence factor n=1 Tax=Mangrovibacillus cuniculi TaxID=2593652 RepID=A0A7S8HFA9_9BACI|nr:conserved virulence factor C family protein [Mangrovibacillus cuniculi]QPC46628.1 virulence factor [Mangrovibacillus cuniculi]
MNITGIEPTPSPNSMKIILDTSLPAGKSFNYSKDKLDGAPDWIHSLFSIEGVKGIYHVADFLALERHPKIDWETILPKVRRVLGEENEETSEKETKIDDHFGEVQVSVLQFKEIPYQVKISTSETEKRVQLSGRFLKAMQDAELPGDNVVFLRKWKEYGIRYGEEEEVAAQIAEEIEASYTEERLNELVSQAKNAGTRPVKQRIEKITLTEDMLENPDWQERFRLLDAMKDPTEEDIPLLQKALKDEKASIRRLAVVYIGMIESPKVIPLLEEAMLDKNMAVRRTAGDTFSDLGFVEGIPAMMKALKDKSKLVRWRAAMFLYEVGDETALTALEEASKDEEFEVALQAKMAAARIKDGEEAKGSVWKQMTEARKGKEE